MEVTKIGESFTVTSITDTYIIGGDITKTVSGVKQGHIISLVPTTTISFRKA